MSGERTVVFVSHKKRQCGVYQFGRSIADALQASTRYTFVYVECNDAAAYVEAVKRAAPSAVIYNYHRGTMPWLNARDVRRFRVPHVGIIHEVTQKVADGANDSLFDFYIAPDPTLVLRNSAVYKTGRLVPAYTNRLPMPSTVTIGSFGFGLQGKGFERLIETVQEQFNDAVVRLHIPYADFGDADGAGAREIASRCQGLIKKDGIQLELSHHFMPRNELMDFLAGNSLNAFFYQEQQGRGIASVTDYALAVDRPVAITRTTMFRHLWGVRPSICIEDSPLSEILERGPAPLRRYARDWCSENLVWDYERIMDSVLARRRPSVRDRARATGRRVAWKVETASPMAKKAIGAARRVLGAAPPPDWVPQLPSDTSETTSYQAPTRVAPYDPDQISYRRFNRILDQNAATHYAPAVAYLFQAVPGMMARKIPAANVQQAFVLDTVAHFARSMVDPSILCVGSFDDTAAAALAVSGFGIDEIDPIINYDLSTYMTRPSCKRSAYDLIFATSVIEHISDDEQFICQIGDLLAPGGVAVLTCDFNDAYRPGDPIPPEDRRFYTRRDLYDRLLPLLPECSLVDEADLGDASPDFVYAGCRYTFASLVFRKKSRGGS
jgi:SAM-dependent methyltransferase